MRTSLEILENLVLLPNNGVIEKWESSEERWEKLFRVVRPGASRYSRELGEKETKTAVHTCIHTHTPNPAVPSNIGGHVSLYISEHKCMHTHSCIPAPRHTYTNCPIIHHPYTYNIYLLYAQSPRKETIFLQIISLFSPLLSFSIQTSSTPLWQQCLTCLLSL